MKKTFKSYIAKYKTINLKTTDGERIQGKVNLTSRQRVSDLFTRSDSQFLVLIDVVSKEGDGRDFSHPIRFINKRHIIWAEPEDT